MTPILLYSQLALEEVPAGDTLADYLRRVIAAAHRARSLVMRILTFSREMDSQEPTVFPLGVPVEEALALLREIVPANIEIVLSAPREALQVLGDASLVHQVVINLCTNACQAMRPVVADRDFYSVYFSRGVLLEAGLIGSRILGADGAGPPGTVQLCRAGDSKLGPDPEEDTPARLRECARQFHAGPEWQHYTGTVEASLAAQEPSAFSAAIT